MKNELLNLVEKTDDTLLDQFLQNNNSDLAIKTDYESVKIDLSWLEKTEEGMEELDKIIRNPKKFIMQEEEVVPIEKAKKITLESIKHLATHTNLIQDYDEETDSLTPSHILNIHKEESFDIYENRFINTLLQNLSLFLKKRKEALGGSNGSFTNFERALRFEGETIINKEKIKLSMSMETKSYEELVNASPSSLSFPERIDRLVLILYDYMKSPFIRELVNAEPVRSPIRKTNIILKNQSFKKALELWEMIETYDLVDKEEIKESAQVEPTKELMEDFGLTFYLNYALLSSIGNKKKEVENTINSYYLNKIIEDYVDKHQDVNEKEFASMIQKLFEQSLKKKKERFKQIKNIFNKAIIKYQKDYNLLIGLFDEK